MQAHSDKQQENKAGSTDQSLSQEHSTASPSFSFFDQRPETERQQSLLHTVNGSSLVQQTAQLQAIADGFSSRQETVQRKINRTGLPDNLKSGIENLSGYSMDDVNVHYNSAKPSGLQAHAYAQGTDIHIAPGQEQHLAHEAWHVVQQKQGRVKPTLQLKERVAVNDEDHLEKEADLMGAKALTSGSGGAQYSEPLHEKTPVNTPVQRIVSTELKLGAEVIVIDYDPGFPFKAFVRARYNSGSGLYKIQIVKIQNGLQTWVWDVEATPEQLMLADRSKQVTEGHDIDGEGIMVEVTLSGDEDHGAESDVGSEETLIDWNDLTKQGFTRMQTVKSERGFPVLFEIFVNLVRYHIDRAKAKMPDNLQELYVIWMQSGVMTRAQFKQLIGLNANFTDNTTTIIQRARTPNTYSFNSDYKGTSNDHDYENIIYKLDGDGNIDFNVDPASIVAAFNTKTGKNIDPTTISWQNPVDNSSEIQMNNDLTDAEKGIMPSGKQITLKTGTRGQHFAIADMLYANDRGGTWTWHHLTPHYKMVLVDMRVHAKHGHNGGVHIWNK